MSGQFADEAAIVTGGSSGIGRATALACAEESTRVTVTARREASFVTDQGIAVDGDWSVY